MVHAKERKQNAFEELEAAQQAFVKRLAGDVQLYVTATVQAQELEHLYDGILGVQSLFRETSQMLNALNISRIDSALLDTFFVRTSFASSTIELIVGFTEFEIFKRNSFFVFSRETFI